MSISSVSYTHLDGAADQAAGETAAGAEHAHDAGHHGTDGKALGGIAGLGVFRLFLVGSDIFILKIRFFIHNVCWLPFLVIER